MEKYAPVIEDAIAASKKDKGVKHLRNRQPTRNKVKLTRKGGIIQVMSIGTNKGEIMSHKGKGAYPDKRVPKPFINEPATPLLEEMTDEIAVATGDVLSYVLVR